MLISHNTRETRETWLWNITFFLLCDPIFRRPQLFIFGYEIHMKMFQKHGSLVFHLCSTYFTCVPAQAFLVFM